MNRLGFTKSLLPTLLALPSCSLIIDANPDGIIERGGAAGQAGTKSTFGYSGSTTKLSTGNLAGSSGASPLGQGGTLGGTTSVSGTAFGGVLVAGSATTMQVAGATFGGHSSGGMGSVSGASGSTMSGGAAGQVASSGAGASGQLGVGGAPIAGTAGVVGTLPAATGLSVATSQPVSRIVRGQNGIMNLTLQRQGSQTGVVELKLQGLPPGVAATPVVVPTGSNSAQVVIQALASSNVGGPYRFTVTAALATNPAIATQLDAQLYVAQVAGRADESLGKAADGTISHAIGSLISTPSDIVVDDKGRTLIGGSYFEDAATQHGWLLRLTPQGDLDPKFGGTGILTNFGSPPSQVTEVTLSNTQPTICALNSNTQYLRKFDDTGSPDLNFGSGGDVVGYWVSRLEPFGTGLVALDGVTSKLSAFASNGATNQAFAPVSASAVAVDSQNRVLYGTVSTHDFEVGRLLSNGTPDLGFGATGITTVLATSVCSAGYDGHNMSAVLVAPDDELLLLVDCYGVIGGNSQYESFILALSQTGQLVQGYGTNGRTMVLAEQANEIRITMQSDGKSVLLLPNPTATVGETSYSLTRYAKSGNLDSTFGTNGAIRLGDGLVSPHPFAMACASGKKSFCPRAMTYDSPSNRISVAGDISGVGIGVFRMWL